MSRTRRSSNALVQGDLKQSAIALSGYGGLAAWTW